MKYFLTCLAAALLVAAGCGDRSNGKLVVRVADVHEQSYPTVRGLAEMGRIVSEKTGGVVRFEIFHSGQLAGGETDSLTQTRAGDIHINRVSAAPLEQFSAKIGVLSLPYIFRSAEHQWNVLNGPIGDELLASLSDANLVGLGWMDSGARSFYCTKRIEKPQDLAGLQIRVQDSDVATAMVRILGASPRSVPFTEVYSALQRGVIDGAENNLPSYHSKGHYEVARFFCRDEHNRLPEVIVASRTWWEKLSPEHRKIIRTAARQCQDYQRRLWAEQEAAALQAVQKAGCTIIDPDRAAFRKAVEPLYEQYRGKYGDLAERIWAVP